MRLFTLLIISVGISSFTLASPLLCKDLFPKNLKSRQVVQALKLLPPETADLFYEVDWGIDAVKDYLKVSEALEKNDDEPIPLENKQALRSGGMTIFRNNIYPDQYFRKLSWSSSTEGTHFTPQELSYRQPWLKWMNKENKYILQFGSTNQSLLSPYIKNGKIKLYRGTSERAAQIFEQAQKENQAESIHKLFERIEALLFTPDKTAAQGWSRGYVIEIEFDASLLMNVSDVYAGVEYNYVEVALINPDILKKSISRVVLHKTRGH